MLVVITILLFIIAWGVSPHIMSFLVIGAFKLALALIALALVGGGIYWLYENSHLLVLLFPITMIGIVIASWIGPLAKLGEPWRKNRV